MLIPRRFWLILICLGPLLLFEGPDSAQAHGYIVRSTPSDRAVLTRAPNQVQVWFSEGLESEFSTIEVYNQQGAQIDNGDGGVDPRNSAKLVVGLPSNLPQGAYLVRMRPVFTSDGHAVNDTLVFWVGDQVGEVASESAADTAVPAEALWRVALSLALTIVFGTIFTYAAVLRPAWGDTRWRGSKLPPNITRRLNLLIWSGLIVATLANIFALFQISATLFETNLAGVVRDQLWEIVLAGTNFGDMWGIRMGLLGAMLAVQMLATQQAKNRPGSTHILWLVNGALSGLALGTLSLISHAAGAQIWPIGAILADYLHLVSVAAWVGGLVTLALVMRPALEPLSPERRGVALAAVIRRFSRFALVSISLIAVTGIYSTVTQVSHPRDLTSTTYGITLLSKWFLLLPVGALGVIHVAIAHPARAQRFARWIDPAKRFVHLPGSLRLEMFFALAVMFAAGWLPATPPPQPENARGDVAIRAEGQRVAGYDISLAVNPGAVGANAYDVRVQQDGQPADVAAVRIRFAYPAFGVYTTPLMLDPTEPGLWVGADGEIDQSATWQAHVDVYPTSTELPIRAIFDWQVVPEIADDNTRRAGLLNGLAAAGIIGMVLFWTVPYLYFAATRLHWTPEHLAVAILSVILTIGVALGGVVIFSDTSRTVEAQRNRPPDLVNPTQADDTSLQAGAILYATQC
ncbi:MAG: copper resistance CopC/CopD family protein, partial [Anaerolineales bacterium]